MLLFLGINPFVQHVVFCKITNIFFCT
uniref:Uncharacterized protein n=1 Tax=Arundo donax TaxID=35708 RepID=A0A0A9C2Z0_ARUDO